MIGFLTPFLNPYDRTARRYPVLICALPILVSISILGTELNIDIWTISGIVLYCGVAVLLTQFARDLGKSLEPTLFELWGGKPSVAMLRHCDTRIDQLTKDRYHDFLQRSVPNLEIPSCEEEKKNPACADETYESANAWLLSKTRDLDRFSLLFRENINYGFRRNLLGLKYWAFGFDAIGIVILFIAGFSFLTVMPPMHIRYIPDLYWVSLILIILHAAFFMIIVRKKWVRTAADTFAKQLLAACDTLASETTP